MPQQFTLRLEVKEAFFDRMKVKKALAKLERRNLSRAGAFVRTSARRSIRRRKKPSLPGRPPHAHSRDKFATIKNILFAYNATRHDVIIGPVRIPSQPVEVPRILEYGGIRPVRSGGRIRRVKQAPRPFMGPALRKEAPRFPGLWAGSLKG